MRRISVFCRCLAAAVAVLAAQVLASCIDDESVETSPLCAITSFSVGSIKSYVAIKKYDSEGNATDTTVMRTVGGSEIRFNISQVADADGFCHITTVDSLANWIDLTRVVPSFNCYGSVFRRVEFEGDTLWHIVASGSDSIDFSQPTQLMCVATDGMSKKTYLVEMNKAANSLDTLAWQGCGRAVGMAAVGKAVNMGGTVVAIGTDDDGATVCARSTDGTTWSKPAPADMQDIDVEGIVCFAGELYTTNGEGSIVRSADGTAWQVASAQKAERTLAADNCFLYIYNGKEILGTADLATFTPQGSRDTGMLPIACVSCVSYPSRTNGDICVSVMTGHVSAQGGSAVAWYKMSATDTDVNQPWAYIQPMADNPYPMPCLSNMSMTSIGHTLYLIGVKDNAYTSIYRSVDNGISWQAMGDSYALPSDLNPDGGMASIINVGGMLWIVQQNGNVWTGSMR